MHEHSFSSIFSLDYFILVNFNTQWLNNFLPFFLLCLVCLVCLVLGNFGGSFIRSVVRSFVLLEQNEYLGKFTD